LAKAEALEQAEVAIAEMAPAPDQQQGTKHDHEAGKIAPKEGSKKKAKTAFYCKMHGPDQRHNTENCKVINAEIEKLKGRKPPPYNNQQQGSEQRKQWTDNKNKRPSATTYTTEQLKEVVRITRKKAMRDAKTKFDAQVQDELHAIEIRENAAQEVQKMNDMEVFVNNLVPSTESESEDDTLTQAELEELAFSFSD
jgi:hypothetical protein